MKLLPVVGRQKEAQNFWLELQKLGVQEEYKNPDKIIVLGGDGTLLGAQRDYYQLNKPFVGIGFGSVNFLLNRNFNNPSHLHLELNKDEWINFSMQAMEVEVITEEGKQEGIAFNDVYLKAANPTESIILNLETREFSNLEVKGDGVIIASPQGSTAYNRNAGGTILPLGSMLWCLTGICTQKRLHVTVAHQTMKVSVRRGKTVLVTDNKIFNQVKEVVIRPSQYQVVISFAQNENFEQRRYNE